MVIEYLFHIDEWCTLKKETSESIDAQFYNMDDLPEASSDHIVRYHARIFKDYREFDNELIIKLRCGYDSSTNRLLTRAVFLCSNINIKI
jgi:hypothetical protein